MSWHVSYGLSFIDLCNSCRKSLLLWNTRYLHFLMNLQCKTLALHKMYRRKGKLLVRKSGHICKMLKVKYVNKFGAKTKISEKFVKMCKIKIHNPEWIIEFHEKNVNKLFTKTISLEKELKWVFKTCQKCQTFLSIFVPFCPQQFIAHYKGWGYLNLRRSPIFDDKAMC